MTKFVRGVGVAAFAMSVGAICACTNTVTPISALEGEGNATAIGITSTFANGPAPLYLAEFALINRTDITCAVLQANQGVDVEYSNFEAVGASVSSQSPIKIGTYEVGAESEDGFGVQAFQEHTDANCATNVDDGTSGKITITSIDDTAIQGSFDIIFQSGSHLKGAFNAPVCELNLNTSGTQPTVCQ